VGGREAREDEDDQAAPPTATGLQTSTVRLLLAKPVARLCSAASAAQQVSCRLVYYSKE
jgi:hypothetical protein